MTKLEEVALDTLGIGSLAELKTARDGKCQKMLDAELTPAIVAALTDEAVVVQVKTVYNVTAAEYANAPHTKDVTDDLIEFINRLPEDSLVLDVGCGVGRDAIFMACNDFISRDLLMNRKDTRGLQTWEKYIAPGHSLRVVAMDNSPAMLAIAKQKLEDMRIGSEKFRTFITFVCEDLHDIQNLEDQHAPRMPYAGIWSCTAMFTHTPKNLLEASVKSLVPLTKKGTIFAASYTNGQVSYSYDKLLISSTGRIKYFSHPDPVEIRQLAQKYGFALLKESYSDFEMPGRPTVKRMFVSQLFERI